MNTPPDMARFPALKSLGLNQCQFDALRRQGSLCGEGVGKRRFKLRFRCDGARVVRYIGVDLQFVADVRHELEELQHEARARRRARRTLRTSRACLRKSKAYLTPVLVASGYHFRGHEIRRKRTDKQIDREGSLLFQGRNIRKMIMDDLSKPQQTPRVARNSQELRGKPAAMASRHQERIDDLARSALDCEDPRQAVLRYTMAKSCSMGAVVVDNVETVLRGCPMSLREFRKNIVPLLSTAANLFKQGARCAQIDREYDQTTEKNGDSLPLLPGGEAEN
jgi:hypothetical protein